MTNQDRLRREILTGQPRCNPTGEIYYQTAKLSVDFGVPEPYVRQILGEMADEGQIYLAAWDGQREKPFAEWQDANPFFASPWDFGHVRVRVLAPGAELLERVPKSSIGFIASA
jgi:hypothetical protein